MDIHHIEKLSDTHAKKQIQQKLGDSYTKEKVFELTSFLNSFYEKPSISQRIWHIKNNFFEIHTCEMCNKPTKFTRGMGYSITCSRTCSDERKRTQEHKNRMKQINIKKYGVEWYTQTQEYKEKAAETNIKKYGVDHYSKTEEFKTTLRETSLRLWGVESYTKTDGFYNKFINGMKRTCLEKYGVENYTQSQEFYAKRNKFIEEQFKIILKEKTGDKYEYVRNLKNRKHEIKCNTCGGIFELSSSLLHQRININDVVCTICNPLIKGYSKGESELCDFVDSLLGYEIQRRTKKIIHSHTNKKQPLELDGYDPKTNMAFEYNGLYWHSSDNVPDDYHKIKTELCESKGIRLIHIFEDDWLYKQEICKSIIQTTIRPEKNIRIYARKCEIKEISLKETNSFLKQNHIQGGVVNFSVCYGLYYKNVLISLMTFKLIDKKAKTYELQRYGILLNHTVVGGAEKIFKYFTSRHEFDGIKTYNDISLFTGGIYSRLGFVKIRRNRPNYMFVDTSENIRISKQSVRKFNNGDYKRINETMSRIYNCGIDVYKFFPTTNQ